MFSSLFGGLSLNNSGAAFLFILTLVSFSAASVLVFYRVLIFHQALINIADMRRDESRLPDISIKTAEEIYANSIPRSHWQFKIYPIILGGSYFALVFFVAARLTLQ